MNIQIAHRALNYLYRACYKRDGKPEQIPYYPQKTESFATRTPAPMPKKTAPELMGVSSEYLTAFLHALEGDRHSAMHNLLIYRHGELICAASAPGYSPRVWSLTHSMAKTVTSFALANMIELGKVSLNTRLVDVFADELPPIVYPRMKKITVEHLLTMTAGVQELNEIGAVTVTGWKREFLACPSFDAPGNTFYYNSMNTYMIAAVVEKVSSLPLEEVLRICLFEPMGITNFFVEKSPEGIAKGGWGMYLTPVDMAKLGQLLLNGGVWQGKRLLSKDYLDAATRPHCRLSEVYGAYDYGYHLWVRRDGESLLLNGMLGQNVWVNPRTDMVIVSTAGNEEFFQNSSTLNIIDAYFGASYRPDTFMTVNPFARAKLRRAESAFFVRRNRVCRERNGHDGPFSRHDLAPIPPRAREILGTYETESNKSGVLPFAVRLVANNHTSGIRRITFSLTGDNFCLQITEGEVTRAYPCGFGGFLYSEQDFQGEKYLVGTTAAFCENEDGEEVFKVDMVFPELPNSRRFKFYFHDGGEMLVALFETPGSGLPGSILGSFAANSPKESQGILEMVRSTMDTREFIQRQIMHSMEPVFYATKTGEGAGKSPSLAKKTSLNAHKVIKKGERK